MSDEPEPALPEAVRQRVVALVADALGALGTDALPPALRRVAAFTPQRRARVAGTQIALALEADEGFRDRVADQLRAQRHDVVAPLVDGVVAPAADPVEVAALAYLLRTDGWPALVERAVADSVDREVVAVRESARADLDRLRRTVDTTRDEARRSRQHFREQVDRLKTENTELRRKVAELRQRERSARAEVEASDQRADQAVTESYAATTAAEAESRRLRGRLAELEQQLTTTRRDGREDRGAASTRTRLLVDTLAEAVAGLRRELALPAVDVLPADLVEARDPDRPSLGDSTGRALRVDDPALLDQLLALPRVHLIVDGYNVTKTGYPTLALDRQRQRLLLDLAPVVARTGAEVTVVFDGAELQHPPPVAGPRGVRVRFSSPGMIADELIRRLVAAEPQGRPVVVVSTDREVVDGVLASGARAVPAATLLALLARS